MSGATETEMDNMRLDIKSPQAGNSTIDGERFGTEKQALTDEKETKVHVQDSLPVLTVAQGNPKDWKGRLLQTSLDILGAFAISRNDLMELLNIFLLVYTLVLSFAIAIQFNFSYEDFQQADLRFLQIRNGDYNMTDLENIYNSVTQYDDVYDCRWVPKVLYAGGGAANRGEGSHGDNFGVWNDNYKCGDDTQNRKDKLTKYLPSFLTYSWSSWAVMLLGGSILMGIVLYVTILICKPLRDQQRYLCFVKMLWPVLALIIVGGCIGIIAFFNLTVSGARVVYPAGSPEIFGIGMLSEVMTWTMIAPTIVYMVATVTISIMLFPRDNEEERELKLGIDVDKGTEFQFKSAKLYDGKRIQKCCMDYPGLANKLFEDAGIDCAGERLELIYRFRKAAKKNNL